MTTCCMLLDAFLVGNEGKVELKIMRRHNKDYNMDRIRNQILLLRILIAE